MCVPESRSNSSPLKKLLVSLLVLGTTALYFGQTVTTAVFTDVVNLTGNGTNNLFQTDAILAPGSPTNIASWTTTGYAATVTTATNHYVSAGDTVVIAGSTAIDGTWTVSSSGLTATTFTFATTIGGSGAAGTVTRPITAKVEPGNGGYVDVTSAQTASTFATGHRIYRTPATPVSTIGSSSIAVGGYTTITTTTAHRLIAGDTVVISGHSGSTPTLNGRYTVATVSSATAFTLAVNVTVGGTGGLVYRADAASTITSSSATNPTTITTPAAHGLVTGDTIFIDGHSGGTTVAVNTISAANPTVITTASAAGLRQGQQVTISGSNSSPSVDGTWTVSSISGNSFTIPVSVSTPGSAGFATNAIYGSYTATVLNTTQFTIPALGGGTGGQFYRVPKANIVSSSASTITTITTTTAGNPTTVTTATSPGITDGQTVFISGNSNSSVNGTWVVSSVAGSGPYTFTIPVNTTSSGAGTGGAVSTGTTITTAASHRLVANDKIFIAGHTASTPPIAGQYTVVAAPTTTTLLLNVSVTTAGAGGTATGPWSQVGADLSPLTTVSYVDSSPPQGVSFYTVRGYYSGQGAIWESPNSNIVGASILNDFSLTMPNPISTTFSAASVASPTSLTVASTAGLYTGDVVTVTTTGGTPSAPTVTGQWTATVVDATHITIPVNVTNAGSPTGTVELGPVVAISSSSVGNPTTITTAAVHNLGTVGTVVPITIYGHTSTPDINGQWLATVTGTNTFTIPTSIDVAGTGGKIGYFDQTAGANYAVTAKARTADGATMLPFTGTSTLTATTGTLACTPSCTAQKATAGVTSFTEMISDSPTTTTSLHVASVAAPSRTGDGKAFHVAPASFAVSVSGTNMKSGVASTVTATAKDAAGATLGTFGGSVTIAVAAGATGSITCTPGCTQPASSGVATFSVTFSDAPYSTKLHASYTYGSLTPVGDSAAFIVGPASFTLSTPTTQTKDVAFATAPTATAKDSTGATTTTFAGSVTLGPSVGTCTAGCTATAVGGIATFTGLTLNTASSAMTLTATYIGAPSNTTGTSGAFRVNGQNYFWSIPGVSTGSTCSSGYNDLKVTSGGVGSFTANMGKTHTLKNVGADFTSADAGTYSVTMNAAANGDKSLTAALSIGTCDSTGKFTLLPGTKASSNQTFATGGGSTIAFTFTSNNAATLSPTVTLAVQVVVGVAAKTTTTALTISMNGTSLVTGPFR